MLKDLKILNGNLELKFNEYTYDYTVVVEDNVDSLEIEYVLSEGATIDIRSNFIQTYVAFSDMKKYVRKAKIIEIIIANKLDFDSFLFVAEFPVVANSRLFGFNISSSALYNKCPTYKHSHNK